MSEEKVKQEVPEIKINYDKMFKRMEEIGMSCNHLASLVCLSPTTFSAMRKGKFTLSAEKCILIADALGVRPHDIFDHLRVIKPDLPDAKDYTNTDISKINNTIVSSSEIKQGANDMKITMEHYSTGNLALYVDGVDIKSRAVMNTEHEIFDGLNITNGSVCYILTGLDSRKLDINKIMFKAHKKLAIQQQFFIFPFAYAYNDEVCLVGINFGKTFMLYKGLVVAQAICL